MGMGYFQPQHSNAHFLAGTNLLDALGNSTCELGQLSIELFVQVKKIVHLFFRNTKYMPFLYGVDI